MCLSQDLFVYPATRPYAVKELRGTFWWFDPGQKNCMESLCVQPDVGLQQYCNDHGQKNAIFKRYPPAMVLIIKEKTVDGDFCNTCCRYGCS